MRTHLHSICLLLFCIFSSFICISCGNSQIKHVESNGYVWYEILENGFKGVVDENGDTLLPCWFQEIRLDTFEYYTNSNFVVCPSQDNFWSWEAVDKNGEYVYIRTWSINVKDTFRYSVFDFSKDTISLTYCRHMEKYKDTYSRKRIIDANFRTIIEAYMTTPSCSYNRRGWPDKHINTLALPITFNAQQGPGRLCVNTNGELLFPASRGYYFPMPYQIGEKCFYLVTIWDAENLFVVCDNQGSEIFRFLGGEEDMFIPSVYSSFSNFYEGGECKEYYKGYKIIEYLGTPYLFYDEYKGFGVLERPKENPYDEDEEYDKYQRWEDIWEEKVREMEISPKILWTGIKIPQSSNSFDVSPSQNNQQASVLPLYEIAKKRSYDQINSYSISNDDYYSSIYDDDYSYDLSSTPAPTPTLPEPYVCRACNHTGICPVCNGTKKEMSLITKDYTNQCRHCRGTGKCPACHGDGIVDPKTEW